MLFLGPSSPCPFNEDLNRAWALHDRECKMYGGERKNKPVLMITVPREKGKHWCVRRQPEEWVPVYKQTKRTKRTPVFRVPVKFDVRFFLARIVVRSAQRGGIFKNNEYIHINRRRD